MNAGIFHGALPMLLEGPVVTRGKAGVLDAISATLLCSGNWMGEAAAMGYQLERKIPGYASLWVTEMVDEVEGPDVVRVEVRGMGLASGGERRVRRMGAGGREWSVGPEERVVIAWSNEEQGEDGGATVDKVRRRVPKLDGDGEIIYKTIATPSGMGARWSIKEAIVTVTDTYFATVRPDVSLVGRVSAPVNPPAVPPYLWAGYGGTMRFRHPNGWVLDDRSVEDICVLSDGLGLWQVTDTRAYYYGAFPE